MSEGDGEAQIRLAEVSVEHLLAQIREVLERHMNDKKLKPIERIERAPEGHYLTHIKGNKFPMVGAPRQTSLWLMEPIKRIVKVLLSELRPFYQEFAKPPDALSPAVKEVHRMFEVLKELETSPGMVQFWGDVQVLVCFFLEEDLAYRWRLQVLAEHIDLEKLKPSEEDRYYLENKTDFKYRKRE
jgi:hypothetical protein